MPNLRLSLLITFFSSNGSAFIHFGVTIVLARLLSPSEIGIFSITAVLTSIAHIFRDFGVGSYLQREKNLTQDKIRAAMGVLITSSWLIALVLLLISEHVAEYYKQPGISSLMPVLAIGFIFIPFGAITRALLIREYRAKEQALVNMCGTIAYATSAIGFAYCDFSYMSLAWANLVNIIVTVLTYMPFRPKNMPWLPSLSGWRSIINFGTGSILGNTIGAINSAIPDIVLGKLSGPHDVGILSRSMSTINIFTQVAGPTIHYATLPFFAKKHHAGEQLKEPLSRAVAYLTGSAWPVIMVTAILAEPVILFLYGEKWVDCVPIIQILCFRTMLNMSFSFTGASLLAIGRPYVEIIPDAWKLIMTIPAIIYIYNGTLVQFAYALLLASLLAYPVTVWVQSRFLGFGPKIFIQSQLKSMAVTAICAGASYVLINAFDSYSPLAKLAIAGAVLTPIWIGLIKYLRHPLWSEFEILGRRIPIIGKIIGVNSSLN